MLDKNKKNETKTKEAQEYEALDALLSQSETETESLESILKQLPEKDQKEVMRILYGDLPDTLVIPEDIQKTADAKNFEIKAFKSNAAAEQRRKPRTVRVASFKTKSFAPHPILWRSNFRQLQTAFQK